MTPSQQSVYPTWTPTAVVPTSGPFTDNTWNIWSALNHESHIHDGVVGQDTPDNISSY